MRGSALLDEIDLVNPDNYVERIPFEWFDYLRANHPVYWHEESPPNHGFWAVTRHEDIVKVHMDWRTFSSEKGAVSLEELTPEQIEIRKSMLETDPPRHRFLRDVCKRWFTPKGVGRYEEFIREVARGVLDRALPLGEFDFVVEVSRELPIRFLCVILGVPLEEADKLIEWGDQMIGNQDPEYAAVVVDKEDTDPYKFLPFRSPTALEVFEYADWMRERKRREPADDVVTALATAEIEGRQLTDHEYHNYFLLLLVAGNETTRHTISHGLLALLEHPDQMRRLRDELSLMPSAVEEMLRWATPVLHFRRTVTRDTELRGQTLREGDKVVTWYVSGNRDESVFKDPYRFDVSRTPNDHVTFGPGGPHFCLGAHLARLESRVMFEELLPRVRSIELTGPVARMRSNFVNGIKHMPVRVTAARASA